MNLAFLTSIFSRQSKLEKKVEALEQQSGVNLTPRIEALEADNTTINQSIVTLNQIVTDFISPKFEDEVFKLDGSRLFSTTGSTDWDFNEGAVIFKASGSINLVNDLVTCDGQIKHKTKIGSKIYPHIHWWQTDNRAYIYTLRYRIQLNGQQKNTVWTTVTAQTATADSIFPYISGTLDQITFFGSGLGVENSGIQLPNDNSMLSAIIQFKFTRTDALTGNISGTSFDYHYEIDSNGSVTQSSKN